MAGVLGELALLWGAVGDDAGVVRPRPAEVTIAADRARITAHLRQVEAELRERDVSALAAPARAARAAAIDHLRDYWPGGVFPRNDGHPGERVPYFVDAEGRPCAMAYLIQQSGALELAAGIASRENNARIDRMRTDLSPWLAANGLTADEAQRVQPSYDHQCKCSDTLNPVCVRVPYDGGETEVTYVNRCAALECASVVETDILHEGACENFTGDAEVGQTFDCVCGAGGPPGMSCAMPGGAIEDMSWLAFGVATALLAGGARMLRRRVR